MTEDQLTPRSTALATTAPSSILSGVKDKRQARLLELEGVINASVEKFKREGTETCWNIGHALGEVEQNDLWRETHPSFRSWVGAKVHVTFGHARKLIDFAGNYSVKQLAAAPLLSLTTFFEVDREARKADSKEEASKVRDAAVAAASTATTKAGAKEAAREAVAGAAPPKATTHAALDRMHPSLTPCAEEKFPLPPRVVVSQGDGVAVDERRDKLSQWRPGAILRVPCGHDGTGICVRLLEGGKFVWWWNRTKAKPQKPRAKVQAK